MSIKDKKSQSGIALAFSLIILLAISIAGLAAARSGVLQLIMSGNKQQERMSFSAANSAIDAAYITVSQEKLSETGLLVAAASASSPLIKHVNSVGDVVDDDQKLDGDRDVAVVTAEVSVEHVGCGQQYAALCPGYSMKAGSSVQCHAYEFKGSGLAAEAVVELEQLASGVSACSL